MASKGLLMAVAGGAVAACALVAGVKSLTSGEFKSRDKSLAGAATGQVRGQLFASVDVKQAAGSNEQRGKADGAADGGETAAQKRAPQPARPDEPMSPDEYEPSELSKMGDDLRHHPRELAELMEQLKNETDPEKIKLLAQLIANNAEAAGYELPIKDILEMAGSTDPNKRLAATMLLGAATKVTPEMMDTIAGLAKTDEAGDVRLLAINTMGRWMDRDANLSDRLSMEIIGARDASTDPSIRGYAIQTVGLQKSGLPPSMVGPVSESLRIEPVPENRSLAALALSHSQATAQPQALSNLQSAYQAETDLDAKRHLVTMIMRSGGDKAPEILKNLSANEPLVQQDIKDYIEIMASGETDVNRIYELKNERDGDRGTETDMDAACLVKH